MSMMLRFASVLFSFFAWDETPLSKSLLVSRYSELEGNGDLVKKLSHVLLHGHPQFLHSARFLLYFCCSPELNQFNLN